MRPRSPVAAKGSGGGEVGWDCMRDGPRVRVVGAWVVASLVSFLGKETGGVVWGLTGLVLGLFAFSREGRELRLNIFSALSGLNEPMCW